MASKLPAFGSSSVAGAKKKKGGKKASGLDNDWGGLLSDSSVGDAGRPEMANPSGSVRPATSAGRKALSDVNDDEFFRNLKTIGKASAGTDSDSDFSLGDDSPVASRKSKPSKPEMGNMEDDLFGTSSKSTAKATPASRPTAKSSTAKKPATADDDLFASDKDDSFGDSDPDQDMGKSTGKGKPPKSAAPASLSTDTTSGPSKGAAVSSSAAKTAPMKSKKTSGVDDFFGEGEGSDFGFDDDDSPKQPARPKTARKSAPLSGSRDGLDSLFGDTDSAGKKEEESGRSSRFQMDSFTSRLGSVKRGQAEPKAGAVSVPDAAQSSDAESGYQPSGPSKTGFTPSGGSAGGGGYMPSAANEPRSRLSQAGSIDSLSSGRPSTAPGRRTKQVHFGKGTESQRPATVPPKAPQSHRAGGDGDILDMLGSSERVGRDANEGKQHNGPNQGATSEYNPTSNSLGLGLETPRRRTQAAGSRSESAMAGSDLFSERPGPSTSTANAVPVHRPATAPSTFSDHLPTSSASTSTEATRQNTQRAGAGPTLLEDMNALPQRVPGNRQSGTRQELGNLSQPNSAGPVDKGTQEKLRSFQEENDRLKAELETLKTSHSHLQGQVSGLESENGKLAADLSAKASEVDTLGKAKTEVEAAASAHAQQLNTMQADLQAAKSALLTAEASKSSAERELASLRDQHDQRYRQLALEKEEVAKRVQTTEADSLRLSTECHQLQSSLTNFKARHTQELEAAQDTYRKREADEKDLNQRNEKRLREEMNQQAEHYRTLLSTAQKEVDSAREQSRQQLSAATDAHREEVDRLRREHERALSLKERQHGQSVEQLKSTHQQELQHALEVAGQVKSLQGLISQVETSTMSLGKLQTEVHSKNDQSLVQREQLVKFKEEQLTELHHKLVERESHFEKEHSRWQESTSRAELHYAEQMRQLEQANWKLQQDEARVKALQKAVGEERQKSSSTAQLQAKEFNEANEKLLAEHHQLVQQCLEERRTLAVERAELSTARQELELHCKTFQDQSSKAQAGLASAMAVAEKRENGIAEQIILLKSTQLEHEKHMSALSSREKKVAAKENELMHSARKLKQSSRELEHVKKALLTSKHHGEHALKETQGKHAEYLRTIGEMQAETARLREEQQRFQEERHQLKRRAQKLVSKCPACRKRVQLADGGKDLGILSMDSTHLAADIVQTKRRAARQLPPKPESPPQTDTTVTGSLAPHNSRQPHPTDQYQDTGSHTPAGDSLHASQLAHQDVHWVSSIAPPSALGQSMPTPAPTSDAAPSLDQQGLERLRERLKVHQAMAQLENRRKQWKQDVEQDQGALRDEDLYLTKLGVLGGVR